jgi:hypothetical protein
MPIEPTSTDIIFRNRREEPPLKESVQPREPALPGGSRGRCWRPRHARVFPVGVFLLLFAPVVSSPIPGMPNGRVHAQQASVFRHDLSLRPGYHGAWRTGRDGGTSEAHDLRMRAQLGAWWTPVPDWAARFRVAGRLSTDQESVRWYLDDHVPATDGLRLGEFTVDEAHLRWMPSERFQLRAGRMQTSFELAGVPRKSLDRNDSPNTDVTWTDGLHASGLVRSGWRQHLILQRNGSSGATNVVRPPLDVGGPGGAITVFTAAQFDGRRGYLIQRGIDLTYMPAAVPAPDAEGGREDYVAVVARAALQPPVAPLGGRVVLGVEAGVAAGAPRRELLGTGLAADGRGEGRAIQISANLMEVGRRHSVGVLFARAGDGWLISPDIRENNREFEARYYWQYAPWGRLDVRVRDREDLRPRTGAARRRHDRDVYVRTTLRF